MTLSPPAFESDSDVWGSLAQPWETTWPNIQDMLKTPFLMGYKGGLFQDLSASGAQVTPHAATKSTKGCTAPHPRVRASNSRSSTTIKKASNERSHQLRAAKPDITPHHHVTGHEIFSKSAPDAISNIGIQLCAKMTTDVVGFKAG